MESNMQYLLKLVTLTRDHGDGSSSTYLYNNIDELILDHRLSEDYFDYDNNGDIIGSKILPEKDKKEIIDKINNDPYEYGNIGKDSIKLLLVDGKIMLAEPTSIYGNQQ
jgi:hypothetical protein